MKLAIIWEEKNLEKEKEEEQRNNHVDVEKECFLGIVRVDFTRHERKIIYDKYI